MTMKTSCLTLYLIICLSVSATAQQGRDKLIDVDFNQANISTVATDLSSKTGYHFYYDPAQLDSLRVTLTLRQAPLHTVLDKMFEKTVYRYVITDQQEVILTRGLQISIDVDVSGDNRPTQTPADNALTDDNKL